MPIQSGLESRVTHTHTCANHIHGKSNRIEYFYADRKDTSVNVITWTDEGQGVYPKNTNSYIMLQSQQQDDRGRQTNIGEEQKER